MHLYGSLALFEYKSSNNSVSLNMHIARKYVVQLHLNFSSVTVYHPSSAKFVHLENAIYLDQ